MALEKRLGDQGCLRDRKDVVGLLVIERGVPTTRVTTNDILGPAESAKDTLCRNVTIYGHCRYEEKGRRVQWPKLRG